MRKENEKSESLSFQNNVSEKGAKEALAGRRALAQPECEEAQNDDEIRVVSLVACAHKIDNLLF